MLRLVSCSWATALTMVLCTPAMAQQTIDLSGELMAEGGSFVLLSFDVPEGTAEIEVQHEGLSDKNVLDWGLEDTHGFRGWGGGNTEPSIVGLHAASRSYIPGPLGAGQWKVVIGKAQVAEQPASFNVQVILRTAPTLAAQPERKLYQPVAALSSEPTWYAGDFHVHSRESGDARPTLDEIAQFARGRGLDFVLLSDHNVMTAHDFLADAQPRHPNLLLIPGMELTTYRGHANLIGASQWVDFRMGLGGVTIDTAIEQTHSQNALLMLNHPTFELGSLCIGCAWQHDLDPATVDAVEIGSGNSLTTGMIIGDTAIEFWDDICDRGSRAAALGGSDDHRAGKDLGAFQSPIGDPTTLVYADELSHEAIVAGVRAGRTVVKMRGPDDPLVVLTPSVAPENGTIQAASVVLSIEITGGGDHTMRFVRNGEALEEIEIDSDPFQHTREVSSPADRTDRWRVEVLDGGKRRTVTSHVWIGPASAAPDSGQDTTESGCGCRLLTAQPRRGIAAGLVLVLGIALARRHSTRNPRGRS